MSNDTVICHTGVLRSCSLFFNVENPKTNKLVGGVNAVVDADGYRKRTIKIMFNSHVAIASFLVV
jgi:hypothetical protein